MREHKMEQNEIFTAIRTFCENGKVVSHRYNSWQHCFLFFDEERKKKAPDINLGCLHLGFYLASWGMYRGSSFLLQKDFLVHYPIVKCLLGEKYQALYDVDEQIKNGQELLSSEIYRLGDEIRQLYLDPYTKTGERENKNKADVSATLITKVMLGAMGCTPAYDDFVRRSLKRKRCVQRFGKKSLEQVIKFIQDNLQTFQQAQNDFKFNNGNSAYPFMKLADMYFWQTGFKKRKH